MKTFEMSAYRVPEIFAGSDFCDFSSFRKNKFPQIKTTANIFPANIYSKVNIL